MDKKEIQDFINLAKENNVSELKYKKKDVELSVSFVSKNQNYITQAPPMNQAGRQTLSATKVQREGHIISAPLVGTFYESSTPGGKAYVSVGQSVKAGDTLCIVEAMKIMNEIESDINGVIKEILVDNEDFIEYGQDLFVIEKK